MNTSSLPKNYPAQPRDGIAMQSPSGLHSAPQLFDNQILRVAEVAKVLSFSKDHIYRLVSQNKIPFRKKGKTLFFIGREIFDWVNEGA